jgi:hypothetical protein
LKRSSIATLGVHPDRSAMLFDDSLANGETHPGARKLTGNMADEFPPVRIAMLLKPAFEQLCVTLHHAKRVAQVM